MLHSAAAINVLSRLGYFLNQLYHLTMNWVNVVLHFLNPTIITTALYFQ
jgi:hypothetical protein